MERLFQKTENSGLIPGQIKPLIIKIGIVFFCFMFNIKKE